MIKITYDNILTGKTDITEAWSDRNARKRVNFLKRGPNFDNIKVKHVTIFEFFKNFKIWD